MWVVTDLEHDLSDETAHNQEIHMMFLDSDRFRVTSDTLLEHFNTTSSYHSSSVCAAASLERLRLSDAGKPPRKPRYWESDDIYKCLAVW